MGGSCWRSRAHSSFLTFLRFGKVGRACQRCSVTWVYSVSAHQKRTIRQPKPGFIAYAAGATLEVCHPLPRTSTTDQAPWRFAFLTSYQQMGQARGECTRGCHCQSKVFDAHRPGLVSQPDVATLWPQAHAGSAYRAHQSAHAHDRACSCTIRLTVLNQTSSGKHKFKLIAVLAGFEPGGYLESGLREGGFRL